MYFRSAVSLLLLLLFYRTRPAKAQLPALPMTLWQGDSQAAWTTTPTWHAESRLEEPNEILIGLDNRQYQGLLSIARAHYDWVKTQPNAPSSTKSLLVAALWDPDSKEVFTSTVPRGPQWQVMRDEAANHQKPPLWYSQVQQLFSGPKRAFLHAEDGAYFNFELNHPQANGKYPTGSLIAVFGSMKGGPPKECSPCGASATSRSPSCEKVARGLGVTFEADLTRLEKDFFNTPDEISSGSDAQVSAFVDDCVDQVQSDPPATRRRGLFRRAASPTAACPSFPFLPDSSIPTITLASSDFDTPTPAPTLTPTPSCSMQDQDPDQGITSARCICDGSVTLPLQSAPSTTIATESCHYTSIPTSAQITAKPTLAPAMTNTKYCQVCTRAVNNEGSCTSISGCVVQTGAVTVQAGSSPVHVGTVTGTQLYTSVSNALETLCPSATQSSVTTCSTDSVTIKGVPYVDAGFLSEGELVVSVESSQYNLTSLRDAMIKSAALTAQHAATGKNCYNQTYMTEGLVKREAPVATQHTALWCNTVGFAGVNYYDPWWRVQQSPGATDWIDARWSFHVAPGGDFVCELLRDVVDAFSVVAPEFAVGDIELRDAVDVLCEGAMGEEG